jgi:hypothetical protein
MAFTHPVVYPVELQPTSSSRPNATLLSEPGLLLSYYLDDVGWIPNATHLTALKRRVQVP